MTNKPQDLFQHCPKCGSALSNPGTNPLACPACGFVFYFNPTIAAGAFLFNEQNEVLWIRRAHEPRKGTLAIPGGFIDFGESVEDGLRREIQEEVGLSVHQLQFITSAVNEYPYKGVVYSVVDCLFAGQLETGAVPKALDGVAALEWHSMEEIKDEELAFNSVRVGRNALQNTRHNRKLTSLPKLFNPHEE